MPIELEPDSLQRRADAQTRARMAQRLPGVEYGVAFIEHNAPAVDESSNERDI